MSQSDINKEEPTQPGWKVAAIIFGFLFGTVALVLIVKSVLF